MKNRQLIGVLVALSLIITVSVLISKWKFNEIGSPNVDRYGKTYNSLRMEHNIPIIEENWIIHEFDSTFVFWTNETRTVNSIEPMHLNKTISFKNKEAVAEEDDFHYETSGEIAYRLVCRTTLTKDSTVTYRFIKYFKNAYPPTVGFAVNIQFADSVFIKWGFPRFYSRKQ